MTIIDRKGNIFDSEAEVIGHGVNTYGVMGAGIAKQIRERFPHVYAAYRRACDSGNFLPGMTLPVEDPDTGVWIMNLASQERPGADARLEWLEESLTEALRQMPNVGLTSLALPQIGAGIGGLEWDDVRSVITELSEEYPEVTIELWEFVPDA